MELNPEEVFKNVTAALKLISKHLKHEDMLISISCMAPIMICMGKTQQALRPAILYNDLRPSTEVDELNERLGVEELLRITGDQANIQQYPPKLLWLKKNEPSTLTKTKKLFDLSTYVIWRLTGEEIVDYTVALESGLLDYAKMKWSEKILSFVDLDSSTLPELHRTVHTNEVTSPNVKSKLGLTQKQQVLITSSCVDAVCAPIGMGLVKEGDISIELGTTGIIYTPTRSPKPDRRLYLDLSPIDGLYFVGGGTAASGLFYEYMIRLLMKNKQANFTLAEKSATTSPPGSNGIVVLPYILGERTPIFDMQARAIIFGLHEENTTNDILHASVEAVAYSFLHHLRIMRENGYRVESGEITGGGAKSRLFRKTMADVLGLSFSYNPSMSSTIGAAYIGYMASGLKKSWAEVKEWHLVRERIDPDLSLRKMYDELFSIYLSLYEKHKDDFKLITKFA